jgi:hypothetical protein
MCTPGEKTYVAEWMQQMYAILLEADPNASIETPSGLTIAQLKDFPSGKKFQNAFIPVQSEDTKQIKMTSLLTMAPALNKVKAKHRRLVEHLQKHNIYIDESFSGSDEEVLLGYFLGIKADKLYVTGFADDLRELITKVELQHGEREVLQEARTKLNWPDEKPPPFQIKVRNITRRHQREEFSSKSVGIIVAKEHRTFFKTLLTRACEEKLFHGIGEYYNVINNDRNFHRIIKWHNDKISKTATLPITGITRSAMLRPLQAKRGKEAQKDKTKTCLRKELCNSGYFTAVHSTRQTHEEGRWILVITAKIHTDAAIKCFNSMIKPVYNADISHIPQNERIDGIETPIVEPRDTSFARSTQLVRTHQASAWDSLLTDNNKMTGGSRMKSNTKLKQRKIVEISFDPESKAQFPDLSQKTSNHKHTRNSKQKVDTSPTSSQGDSAISAVTRAEFESLSLGISQMVKDEVQSTLIWHNVSASISRYVYHPLQHATGPKHQIKILLRQQLVAETHRASTESSMDQPHQLLSLGL